MQPPLDRICSWDPTSPRSPGHQPSLNQARKIPSAAVTRIMSTNAPSSQNSSSPSNSGQESACVKLEAQDDADSPAVEPLSPIAQVPASNPSHIRKVSKFSAPVNQHSLASFEYSDLEFACDGHQYSIHKIIICSESPVLKAMCSNLVSLHKWLVTSTSFPIMHLC